MKNKIKLITNELDKITVPTISILNTFDSELLGLVGILLLQSSMNIPEELDLFLNDGISSENLEAILDKFSMKDLNSITKQHLIMGVSELKGFDNIEFEFKSCKITKQNKNDIYSFINAFYFKEYINPFLSSGKSDINVIDLFYDKISKIEKSNDNLSKVLSYYYLLDSLLLIEDNILNENESLISTVLVNISKSLSLEVRTTYDKIFTLLNDCSDNKIEINNLNEKISDLRAEMNVSKKEKKLLENKLAEKSNKEKNVLLKEIKKEIENSTKKIQDYNVDVLKRSYEGIIKRNNQEISELKINLKLSENKLKSIENEFFTFKESINDNFILDYIYENINNHDFIENISNMLNKSNVVALRECVLTKSSTKNEDKSDKEDNESFEDLYNSTITNDTYEVEDNNVFIGYVSINNNTHFVHYTNGNTLEITELPERAFLGEGQFIATNSKGKYLYSFKQYCNDDIPLNSTLAIIKEIYNEVVAIVNNSEIKIDNHLNFKIIGSVIGIIDDNKIKKLFKSLVFNADYFMKSIKAKGYTPYYVVKSTKNELIIRNIENGIELKKTFDDYYNNDDILILDNEFKVLTSFNNIRFYVNSSYYKNDKYGTISHRYCNTYFKDIYTDEEYELNNLSSFNEGTIIRLDEFNRFIEVISDESFIPDRSLRKNNKKKKSTNIEDEEEEDINIIGNVLIIGDIGLQHSYKLASLKKGYVATVLDGYESYNKVYREAKKADKIVITEGFVDHNIMWELRKQYDNIIFAKNKGANFIAEQLSKNIVGRKQLDLIEHGLK